QFHPHTGRVLHFAAPPATAFERAAPGALRFDHALEQGSEVSPHYDAMLGKLIVHAATRGEAIAALVRALHATSVLGLPTNRAFLAQCLAHPQFGAGQALVPFLAQQADAIRDALLKEELSALVPSALAAIFTANPAGAPALPCSLPRPLRLRHQGQVHALAVRELGGGRLQLAGADPATGEALDGSVQLAVQADGSVRVTPLGRARAEHRVR